MVRTIEGLRGRLVVSCQPVSPGPLDGPVFVVGFALAALAGGAAGLRVEGVANVAAVRAATDAPIIGLVKRAAPGTDIIITPSVADVAELARAGADVVAFDATGRRGARPVAEMVAAARAFGVLAMADVATADDARVACAADVDVVGTTLSGYTGGPVPEEPDLDLVAACADLGRPVFAEGRIRTPAQARAALKRGAHAVVVGSAITRVEHITGWFVQALEAR